MMSEAMAEVPLTHPMRAAWEKYKETDEYANSRKWALHPEAADRQYVDGSMWAAFCAGWHTAQANRDSTPPPALPDDRLKWKDLDVVIDGRTWEALGLTGDTDHGVTGARVHIGQNRWRHARLVDGVWEWENPSS